MTPAQRYKMTMQNGTWKDTYSFVNKRVNERLKQIRGLSDLSLEFQQSIREQIEREVLQDNRLEWTPEDIEGFRYYNQRRAQEKLDKEWAEGTWFTPKHSTPAPKATPLYAPGSYEREVQIANFRRNQERIEQERTIRQGEVIRKSFNSNDHKWEYHHQRLNPNIEIWLSRIFALLNNKLDQPAPALQASAAGLPYCSVNIA